MAQGTWRRLVLLSIWAAVLLVRIQYVTTEVRLPCGMVKDWFPSDVKPQTSKAPYVLDVIRPDGKSVFDMFSGEPHYGPGEELTYTIFLNGTDSDNVTETFTGFIIYIYNEFEDEESGHFVKPLPAGVSMKECHFNGTSQWIEYVENSTSTNRSSLEVEWKSPKKYPAGKITISVSVVKEQGVYWEGITLTLHHACPVAGCAPDDDCPHGFAKTKFGCQTCECAGATSITVGFTSLLVIAFTFLSNLI